MPQRPKGKPPSDSTVACRKVYPLFALPLLFAIFPPFVLFNYTVSRSCHCYTFREVSLLTELLSIGHHQRNNLFGASWLRRSLLFGYRRDPKVGPLPIVLLRVGRCTPCYLSHHCSWYAFLWLCFRFQAEGQPCNRTVILLFSRFDDHAWKQTAIGVQEGRSNIKDDAIRSSRECSTHRMAGCPKRKGVHQQEMKHKLED
ncbi:hypothetical protein B0O80DRAFT_47427 [Mortierella sp. GBAus27b]|nr:hypothetical protein B0O80DRAFT_47427 [Mortierella sp. GBAus27b]